MFGRRLRLARSGAVAACLTLLLVIFAFEAKPQAADPAGFISNLASKAIPVLTDSSIPQTQREANFRSLMKEGFDIQQIAQLVLGRYWRQASADEKQEFTRLLEDYLVRIYADRFTQYANVSLDVGGVRDEPDGAIVHSTLVRPSGPPVNLDWRVEQDNGRYSITDLVVEGVSMVITQRSEFASVIRQGGGQIQALIDVLRRKVGA